MSKRPIRTHTHTAGEDDLPKAVDWCEVCGEYHPVETVRDHHQVAVDYEREYGVSI